MPSSQFILTITTTTTTTTNDAAQPGVLAAAADAIRKHLGDPDATVELDPAPEEVPIIVAGNPFDGLVVFGGFRDPADREDWTDRNLQGEHWWYPPVIDVTSADAQGATENLHASG